MADSLKAVIDRINANKNSQASIKPAPTSPVQAKTVIPTAEVEEEFDEELDLPALQPAKAPQQNDAEVLKQEQIDQIVREIEMLQNNGRYRAELLHQISSINETLVVIAGVLADWKNGKA